MLNLGLFWAQICSFWTHFELNLGQKMAVLKSFRQRCSHLEVVGAILKAKTVQLGGVSFTLCVSLSCLSLRLNILVLHCKLYLKLTTQGQKNVN